MRKFAIAALVLVFIAGVAFGQDLGEIKKKIKDAAKFQDWAGVAEGIRGLGAINSLESAKTALKYGFLLDQYDVPDGAKANAYDAAKEALGKITDEEAVAYMRQQMLKNKTWEVRQVLAAVLGDKGGEENRKAICELVCKERQPEVIRELVRSVVKIGGYDSVGALIDALGRLEKSKGLAWVDARKALTKLTSADYATAREWRDYWVVREAELKANPDAPDASAGAVKDGEMKTGLVGLDKKKTPRFFGKEILSKRFCFVIDISGSMAAKDTYSGGEGGKPVQSTRIEMVKDQLIKLISALDSRTKFNIVSYSQMVKAWKKRKLVPANSGNKKAAIEFVKKMKPFGTTHTDEALKEAFENKEADTMVLLSDGAPTHTGNYSDTSGLISNVFDFVRNANRSRKAVIDTFGFESVDTLPKGQECLDFLKKLASENNGKFTAIK